MPEYRPIEATDPAAVHALLDALQAAELAWLVLHVPHIRTLRRMNTYDMPPQARAVFSRMIAMGAKECREFAGLVIGALNKSNDSSTITEGEP